jgi:integrase/recombinase XerD
MTLEEYLRKNYSPTTIQGYMYIIRTFIDRQHGAEKVGYKEVLDYIGELRKDGKHPKTLKNHLFGIKIYYRYLLEIGVRKDHPCASMSLQDKVDRSIDVQSLYSMEALEKFVESYKPSKKMRASQQRERVILSLLIHQALTVLEISQLDMEDLDLEAATIRIKGNTKNRGRTLDLKPSQIMQLHRYIRTTRKKLSKNPEQRALLLNEKGARIKPHGISRQINRGRKPSERMRPLKIRQSVIAHLLKSGNDLRIVQVFAGHRRAMSTEQYKQSGMEELKAAIQQKHPLQ